MSRLIFNYFFHQCTILTVRLFNVTICCGTNIPYSIVITTIMTQVTIQMFTTDKYLNLPFDNGCIIVSTDAINTIISTTKQVLTVSKKLGSIIFALPLLSIVTTTVAPDFTT